MSPDIFLERPSGVGTGSFQSDSEFLLSEDNGGEGHEESDGYYTSSAAPSEIDIETALFMRAMGRDLSRWPMSRVV